MSMCISMLYVGGKCACMCTEDYNRKIKKRKEKKRMSPKVSKQAICCVERP